MAGEHCKYLWCVFGWSGAQAKRAGNVYHRDTSKWFFSHSKVSEDHSLPPSPSTPLSPKYPEHKAELHEKPEAASGGGGHHGRREPAFKRHKVRGDQMSFIQAVFWFARGIFRDSSEY